MESADRMGRFDGGILAWVWVESSRKWADWSGLRWAQDFGALFADIDNDETVIELPESSRRQLLAEVTTAHRISQ